MKRAFALLIVTCATVAVAQSALRSATVPVTLDHNRIIIDVYFPMPDGSKTRVRAWVDNGSDNLCLTEELAEKLNLQFTGEPREVDGLKVRMVKPPEQLLIGDMPVRIGMVKEALAILDRESIAPGMSARINLPASVLRDYDVLVDYPNREFTIASPGALHFKGAATHAFVNDNGLIQIPATVGATKQSLGLDLGATVSFISDDMLTRWLKGHPKWPRMTGAVGPANSWGLEDEPTWTLARLPRLEYGGTVLSNILAASFSGKEIGWIEKRGGQPSTGVIGADAFLNYRVGLDYANRTVYFDQTSKFSFRNMDVVGLVLRPEPDGRYRVIGVADYNGKPAVPDVQNGDVLMTADGGRVTGATMGQVWSLLSGSPGSVRTLTLDRAGNQITVNTKVISFLSASVAKTGHSLTHQKKRK